MNPSNESNLPTEFSDPENDSEVLLFETSPYGNVDAIVQQDGRTVYFYLNPRRPTTSNATAHQNSDPTWQTKACWVRNLQPGPYVINQDEMRAGIPPLLPRTHTISQQLGILPQSENLQVVWFEEGNGAALIEKITNPSKSPHSTDVAQSPQQTIAVIPPWSGVDGFHGYAAQCASETVICWPLPTNPKLEQRIERAAEFWESLHHSPDPFVELQQTILAYYERKLTDRQSPPNDLSQYYVINEGSFPPCGMIHQQTKQHHFLATVAMSFCPQPTVELSSDAPQILRRIELAVKLPTTATVAEIDAAQLGLSRLARYPWQFFRWFGPGHTCQFPGVFPETEVAKLVPDLELNINGDDPNESGLTFRGDPVHVLWLVPSQ